MGREGGDRPEAGGESKRLELKPGFQVVLKTFVMVGEKNIFLLGSVLA